jgi:lactate dehydrogenase-like 2-hydroxyacid dehydrogenase
LEVVALSARFQELEFMKPDILAVEKLPPFLENRLRAAFTFHDHDQNAAALASIGGKVRGLVALGTSTVTGEFMAQFPALEIISVFGVGYDGIDIQAAHKRGIVVTNTPDVLTDDVADLCLGLILSVSREIPAAERFLRSGQWKKGQYRLARKVSGSRLGIIGLGRIGSAIARRAEGFAMSIAYTDLKEKPGVPYRFYPTLLELAANSDFLAVAAFGGSTTRNLVNAEVFKALGPQGFLINIARGSLVDEPALVEALKNHTIRGAAIDVYANEPNVPAELLTMDNVVLTPHMASGTVQTRHAMADLTFANLEAHFEGRPVLTPVSR